MKPILRLKQLMFSFTDYFLMHSYYYYVENVCWRVAAGLERNLDA